MRLASARSFIGATGKFGINGSVLNEASSAGSLANVGLAFVPNVGQMSAAAQYVAQGAGYSAFLTPTGPVLSMATYASAATPSAQADSGTVSVAPPTPSGTVSLGMTLVGGNANAAPVAQDQLASHTNYFVGPQSDWKTNVANYGAVEYQNVYSGINAVYSGAGQNLRDDFVVNPGASVSEIALTFPGWQASVAADGSLVLYQPQANVTMYEPAPTLYQANGASVYGNYVNLGGGKIGFQVGAYDHSQTLTIDPTLVYSHLRRRQCRRSGRGASPYPSGVSRMAVDSSGNAYVVTPTSSNNFPTVTGFLRDDGSQHDRGHRRLQAEPCRLQPDLFDLPGEQQQGQRRRSSPSTAVVTPMWPRRPTSQFQYPTTPGSYKPLPPVGFTSDIVVTELGPNGDKLVYSTYITNGTSDNPYGIAVDSSGSVPHGRGQRQDLAGDGRRVSDQYQRARHRQR